METYNVVLVSLKTKTQTNMLVEADEAESSENIFIKANCFGHQIVSENFSYFNAFQAFRDNLIQLGYGIKCNGSRLNAVASQMMSATDKIYLVQMGRQALMKDIVHIFDYSDIENFPDTADQTEFYQKWAK